MAISFAPIAPCLSSDIAFSATEVTSLPSSAGSPRTQPDPVPIGADPQDLASPYAVFTFAGEHLDGAESLCNQTGPGWHCETHPLEGIGQSLLVLSKQSQRSSVTESAGQNPKLLPSDSEARASHDALREKMEVLLRLHLAGATNKDLQTILPPQWSRVRTTVVTEQAGQDPVLTCQSEPLDAVTVSPRTVWFDEQGFATGFQERNWIKRSELSKAAGRVRCLQIWASPSPVPTLQGARLSPRTLHTGVSQPVGKDRLIWLSEPQKPLWLLWDLEARSATLSMHVTVRLPRSAKLHCTIMNSLGTELLLKSACPEGLRPISMSKTIYRVDLQLSNSELERLWHAAQTPTDQNDRYAPRQLLLRIATEHGDAEVYGDFRLDLLRTNYAPKIEAGREAKSHRSHDSESSASWCVSRISDPEDDHVVASLLLGAPSSKAALPAPNKLGMWASWHKSFKNRRSPSEHNFAEPAGRGDECTLIASDGVLVSTSTSQSVPVSAPSHVNRDDRPAKEPALNIWSRSPETGPRASFPSPQPPTVAPGHWYLTPTGVDGSISRRMLQDAAPLLRDRRLLACLDSQGQSCMKSLLRQRKHKSLLIDASFRSGRHFVLSSSQNQEDTTLDVVEVVNPTATALLGPIPSRSRWYASLAHAAQQASQRPASRAGLPASQQEEQSVWAHCYAPASDAQECSRVQAVLKSKIAAKQKLDFHKNVEISSQLVIVVITANPGASTGYQSILFTQSEETLQGPQPRGGARKPAGD